MTDEYSASDNLAQRLPSGDVEFDPQSQESMESAYTYDEYGRVVAETTSVGTTQEATTTSTFTDDAQGGTSCQTETVDPTGAVTEFECDAEGRVTRIVQHIRAVASQPAQQRVTESTYDNMGRVIVEARPEGGRIETEYDLAGRPIRTRELVDDGGTPSDPGDDVWAVTERQYDPAARLLVETLPDPDAEGPLASPEVLHDYDSVGNAIERIDERGYAWETHYDAQNRTIAEVTASGLVTATDYELIRLGDYVNRITVTDPSGVDSVTHFDTLRRSISEKIGTFAPALFVYDVEGNLVRSSDPAGVWTEQEYDGVGRVTEERSPYGDVSDPEVATTTYRYDTAGNLMETDGPRTDVDDSLAYEYDLQGRLTAVAQSGIELPNQTAFIYDDAGELVKVTDPEGRVREWVFDKDGREHAFSDALGTTTSYYNNAGWLVRQDDPRGFILHYSFDAVGREVRRWAVEGGQEQDAETFTYDASGNVLSALAADSVTETAFIYDEDGRSVEVNQAGDVTEYEYDASTPGKLASVTSPAGGTTSYGYNENGLLATLVDSLTYQETTYGYDPVSGMNLSRIDPTGNLWMSGYDAAGRVDSRVISGPGGTASFQVEFDPAGNVVRKDQTIAGAPAEENGTWIYAYDGANRLITATDPELETLQFAYDGAGNRTGVTVGLNPAIVTSYDSASLPISSSDGTAYTHDQVGSLTSVQGSGSGWVFGYDAWRRMTSAEGTTTQSYEYDALGRVIRRGEAVGTTWFRYMGETDSLAATIEGGQLTRYAYSPGGPLVQEVDEEVRFFLSDLHEDIVGLVDLDGETTGTRTYGAWGEPRSAHGEQALLGFQGRPADPATGFVDMVTRYYSPITGRFTSRDVLFGENTKPISLNQFIYASDNPVTLVDRDGMSPTVPNSRLTWRYLGWASVWGEKTFAVHWDGRVAILAKPKRTRSARFVVAASPRRWGRANGVAKGFTPWDAPATKWRWTVLVFRGNQAHYYPGPYRSTVYTIRIVGISFGDQHLYGRTSRVFQIMVFVRDCPGGIRPC